MPIDINLLRVERGGNPDIVRESQKKRNASVELVDKVIALDLVIYFLFILNKYSLYIINKGMACSVTKS